MIRCLYVDDEPGLLELTKEFLERGGDISVNTCDSPERALEALKATALDVVISDYQMPGMDGIQLFNEVRKGWRDVPFVLFTGKGREEVAIKALNAGIDLYINKGGNPRAQFAELANAIRQLARRREAEDAVSYNNRKFRNIIESIMDVVLIIDGRGMIQYVSPSVYQSIRFRQEEILGTCIFDRIHIDDRASMINSTTCSSEAVIPLQCRVMTRDGEYKWFESISRPVPPELGRGRFILSSRDIDDRKRMEMEIARREMLLKAVYDNSTDMMGIISPEGTIQMVNRRFCEISRFDEDELISRRFLDFVSPDSRDTASRNLRVKMAGGSERTSYRAMMRRRDGVDIWLSVTSQRIDVPGLESVVLVMGNELIGDDDVPDATTGDRPECGTITSPVISLQAHGPEDI